MQYLDTRTISLLTTYRIAIIILLGKASPLPTTLNKRPHIYEFVYYEGEEYFLKGIKRVPRKI